MQFSLQILGSGIPNKIWKAIIEHANTCVVDDDKLYCYNHAPQKHCLLFNSVHKVVGAIFDGESFVPLDKLTAHQKVSILAFVNPDIFFMVIVTITNC